MLETIFIIIIITLNLGKLCVVDTFSYERVNQVRI